MSKFVLNIRPDGDAALDMATLQRRGVAARSAPVMAVQRLDPSQHKQHEKPIPAPETVSGLIFTSRHAVSLFVADIDMARWRDKPVYVVGGATARAAAKAGFETVMTSASVNPGDAIPGNINAGGGAALVPVIIAHHPSPHHPDAPLLWPCALHKSFDMAAALEAHGLQVLARPIYQTNSAESLPTDIVAAIAAGDVLAVISLSARTSQLFVRLLQSHNLMECRGTITLIAGSQSIADAAGVGWADVIVARQPKRSRLLAIATLIFRRDVI